MQLHPHEIKVLKAVGQKMSPSEISEITEIPYDAVLRAGSWLKTKKLLDIEERIIENVSLEGEGVEYAEKGLPERQLIGLIGKEISLDDLKSKVDGKLFGIGFGWLKKKRMVEIKDGMINVIRNDETSDEKLLNLLKNGSITTDELDEDLKRGLDDLKSRKSLISIRERKHIFFIPTKTGLAVANEAEVDNSISQLTPKIIISKSWRQRGFRPYDPKIWVNPISPAKKHPVSRQIAKVRRIFVEMGFSEIKGPLVESAFWNFDALFQPQDHPARDMHDTFYLENPKDVEMGGEFDNLKKEVGKTHENGANTGSIGWGYKWAEDIAKLGLLRTHTTAVTARHLAKTKPEDLPVKVFSIDKVFRNEAIDYKHLPEFFQVEGIVVDPSVNFRNLLGILKQFYDKMGFKKVRFRPGYFPYTELSVEPEVYMEEKQQWIELGGAGIFRPEVVKPLLGIDCPVLAWGLGLDRVVTLSLGLTDIRQLYLSDIDWLKSI